MEQQTNRKVNPDHKASFTFTAQANCSCGWSSSPWIGKGAKKNAAAEWRSHRIACETKSA